MSFVCGSSFSAAHMCSSNAFDLSIFSMPLSKMGIARFQYKRVYSLVLLEDVPQLIIAITFAIMVGIEDTFSGNNGIVYVSMAFSALSIFMTIVSSQTTKHLLNTQGHGTISLNVTGPMFGANNITKCRRQTNKIRQQMAALLGIDESLVEIPKPQETHGGIRLDFMFRVNNRRSTELDGRNKIHDPDANGVIAAFIKDAWQFNALPNTEVVKYKHNQPKLQPKLPAQQIEMQNEGAEGDVVEGEVDQETAYLA
eukprot:232584_1